VTRAREALGVCDEDAVFDGERRRRRRGVQRVVDGPALRLRGALFSCFTDPVSQTKSTASTAAPKCAAASIFQRPPGRTSIARAEIVVMIRRATIDLQRNASFPRRPTSASSRRSIIHSEMSKLLFPVIASRPVSRRPFSFFGRFEEPSTPSPAFVTHGGFPTTRIGSGSAPMARDQSTSKKSESSMRARALAPARVRRRRASTA
jgi:hypothetical protein